MGTRSRLFASAAFPLLSLSLMLQPVNAAMLVGATSVAAGHQNDTASYDVAQAAAEPAEDDQDPKKRKKPPEEPGKEPPKGEKRAEPEAPRPPKAEKPPEPEAPRPPKAEKPAEPEAPRPPKAEKAPEPEAPRPPKAEKPVEPEAPKAEKPMAEPEAPKPPKAEKPAAEPEAPKPPKAEKPAAEPEVKPEQRKLQDPAAEAPAVKPKAEAPAAEPTAPAAQPEAPQPTRKHQKPADANGEAAPVAPVAPGEKPAKPEMPAEKVAPTAEKPAAPAAEGEKPARPAAPPAPAAEGQKPVAPGTEPPAPAANGKPAPAGAAAPAAIAPAEPAQAAPTTAGEQVSPAELERRKKIAENPTAAGAGAGPVILPVQNGTAVLDSDKDAARRGHRGQPGNGQPPAPGQPPVAGQPAPAGQAAGGPRPPAPANVPPPTSDADSQRVVGGNQAPPVKIEAVTSEQGRRMDRRPDFVSPEGVRIDDRQDNRVIVNFGDNVYVRHDDTQRFVRDGERPVYEQLPRDRYRETIDRPDGDRIITVRNRYGDIIQRSRIDARGREYVLFYSPELENTPDQDDYYRDPGDELPPMRLSIPLNQYIIDTSADQDQDYYDFLRKPPVERVERVYSLNEVRYSARLRDKVRRIDLDTITFATGSAEIPMEQAKTLRSIADAIGKIVKKDPTETFLIEGHTDAVGSAQSNLILSDQRAESVANVLTDVYGIPPENLATQGYGEQYLKINTDGPEQENRRVTIRRVTALVRPVAAK